MTDRPALRVLVGCQPGKLTGLAEQVEADFAHRHHALLQRVGRLEDAVETRDGPAAQGLREQAAFVRVGLRCIADAIGELAAHASDLDVAGHERNLGGAPTRPPA
jgi:hypothetical protein